MNIKNEIRFYLCIILGYSLMIISLFIPPVGIIPTSVLFGSGMFLVIGGLCVGVDIRGVLSEIKGIKALNKDILTAKTSLNKDENI